MSINVTILPYMRSDAYQTGQMNSDYQIDQVYIGLSVIPEVNVQQIPRNPIVYKNCPPDMLKRSWGMGWTIYGLMEENNVSFDVGDSDLILIGLHHTMSHDLAGFHNAVKQTVDRFGKEKVCVIDGADFDHYSDETAQICKAYFKRELMDDRTTALPIFFAIPEEKFAHYTLTNLPVEKIYDFSPMVPAMYNWFPESPHVSSYCYKTEEEYYLQYQQSYFAYNCKKAGWTTNRQNECIANGTIPYFTDLEICPKNCLFNYPKELCLEAKRLKGVIPGTVTEWNPEVSTYIGDTRNIRPGEERGKIDWDKFDLKEYNILLEAIIKHGWINLTTKALARYILGEAL